MPETTAEGRLAELGLVLPAIPAPMANYVPYKRDGNVIYLSGQGARRAEGGFYTGKVGAEVDVAQAYEHAKLIGLALLSTAKEAAGGSLENIEVLKVLGMVNGIPEFGEQPAVINGCSDLFVAVLGARGRHARSAVGMASLPMGITVEIEAIMRIVT